MVLGKRVDNTIDKTHSDIVKKIRTRDVKKGGGGAVPPPFLLMEKFSIVNLRQKQ